MSEWRIIDLDVFDKVYDRFYAAQEKFLADLPEDHERVDDDVFLEYLLDCADRIGGEK